MDLGKYKNKCEKMKSNITNVENKGKKITEKTKGVISEVKVLNTKLEKCRDKNKDLQEQILRSGNELLKIKKEFELSKKDLSKREYEINVKDKRLE